jgi:hypothetical protein
MLHIKAWGLLRQQHCVVVIEALVLMIQLIKQLQQQQTHSTPWVARLQHALVTLGIVVVA